MSVRAELVVDIYGSDLPPSSPIWITYSHGDYLGRTERRSRPNGTLHTNLAVDEITDGYTETVTIALGTRDEQDKYGSVVVSLETE